MKKTALNGVMLLATVWLSGCETNPTLSADLERLMAPKKTPPTSTVSQVAVIPSSNSVQQTSEHSSDKNLDLTGLVGKTLTPKTMPKNSDNFMMEYGNGYFDCGGSAWTSADLENKSLIFMRKGLKTKCGGPNYIAAIVRYSNNGKKIEFFNTMDFLLPRGYLVVKTGCIGAAFAIAKDEDVAIYTKFSNAWIITGNQFIPVKNLNSVKCENVGYGV